MRRVMVLVVAAVVLRSLPAGGQPASGAGSGGDAASQLAEINATMKDIVDLLARQAEAQKLDLLMKRIQLTAARMAQTEQALQPVRAEEASLEDQKQRMEDRLATVVAEFDSGALDVSAVELEMVTDQIEGELERTTSRLRALGPRIADLEHRLATQSADLQAWQDFVDRELEGL